VRSINRISKNKESILEKTYQGTSSLDFRPNKINPLCYSSGTPEGGGRCKILLIV